MSDRFDAARSVADAVLYEGYVLYPYRASSRKNQVRFQWGVLTPRTYSEADGSEAWHIRTECLVDPRRGARREGEDGGHERPGPMLHVRVRCLHTQHRDVEAVSLETGLTKPEPLFDPVDCLEVDQARHVAWDEALDRVVDVGPVPITPGAAVDHAHHFTLEGGEEEEPVHAEGGALAGRFVRRRQTVEGTVRVTAAPVQKGSPYVKVGVTVENTSPWWGGSARRSDALARSLVAVHTMLAVDDGRFVSLLDPPDEAAEAAAGCKSEGSYPVLIGDEDVVLSSPIILYDHPEVAGQSPGELYDSLEIDEILALRVMTLTDEEKAEARGTDPRAAAIIERCEDMPADVLGRLHGEMRASSGWDVLVLPGDEAGDEAGDDAGDHSGDDRGGAASVPWWDPAQDKAVDPWTDSVRVGGTELRQGSPVRLRPSGRADAQDMFVDGRTATVAGVFADVDGGCHLAVTLDDDPAAGELVWQGRYLYFRPDEVEPLP